MLLIDDKLTKRHLLWEQGVAGSNPATSTSRNKLNPHHKRWGFLFITDLLVCYIIYYYFHKLPQAKLPQDVKKLPQDSYFSHL